MSEAEPVKRSRGRPRKHPPAPSPAPRLDPRRFAAAYAAYLMIHGSARPTTAANAAALIFASGFGLYETDLIRHRPRQKTPTRYNATARWPGSVDEAKRDQGGIEWPIARLRSEGKMIGRSLARMKADPVKAAWLTQSIMLIAIMSQPINDEATQRVVAAMIEKLGWADVLPKLAKAIMTPQKHTKSIA